MKKIKSEPQTFFSIYKIDIGMVISEDDTKTSINEVRDRILTEIEEKLNNKSTCNEVKEYSQGDFKVLVFQTENPPQWKGLIASFIDATDEEEQLEYDGICSNISISYILLYIKGNGIYAMTGGYGSHYIENYIEKNFGLYLLPKLISKQTAVVKGVNEKNLTGNRLSTQQENRTATSILVEQNLSSIYSELVVELDKDKASDLGILLDSDKQKINILNKDSIVIRKSLTINQLEQVISKIAEVESREAEFALNYFVLARSKGVKDTELMRTLVEQFKNEDYSHFIIYGSDYEKYYYRASSYSLMDEDGKIILEKSEPINLEDIFQLIHDLNIKMSLGRTDTIIRRWMMNTWDNSGSILMYRKPLFDLLQGYIQYRDKTIYLSYGRWYIIDDTFTNILKQEYLELYKQNISKEKVLKTLFPFRIGKGEKEDDYNREYIKNSEVIMAHTTLLNNIELADLIFVKDNVLYLLHNKMNFDGSGIRDLSNQIITAAQFIQFSYSTERTQLFKDYYIGICKTNHVTIHPAMTQEKFVEAFTTCKICFVAGFMKGFKKNTKSRYCEYLLVELKKKLQEKGMNLIVADLSSK